MIQPNATVGPVLERIETENPGIRQALDARRRILEDAQWFRDSCEKQEDPIRRWEIKVREKHPRGRRWKSLLTDGKKLLSAAGNLYLTVLGSEQEALRHLRSATEQLRDLLGRPDLGLDPRMPEMLDQCARLREQEIRWIEEIVSLTHRIETLNGEATPDQVRSLLELRRRYLDQVKMLRETSRSLEERAFQITASSDNGSEGPKTAGSSGEDMHQGATATVEEILDVEFEDLDKKLRTFSEDRDQALSKFAGLEAKYEDEAERGEDLTKKLAAAEAERDQALRERDEAVATRDGAVTVREELEDSIRTLTEENGDLVRRLQEAEGQLTEAAKRYEEHATVIEAANREKEAVAAELEASETKFRHETSRREALEEELGKMEAERDKTLGLLAEAEGRVVAAQAGFDEERQALMSRIESAQCARDEAEARRRDELRRLREAVRGLTSRVDEEIKGFEGQ